MSSSETRLNPRSGSESHRVRHRHDGKHLTVTFDSLDAAKAWRAVLDASAATPRRAFSTSPRPRCIAPSPSRSKTHDRPGRA